MDLKLGPAGRYVRIVAMISLLLGLNDAARLLGVSNGETSPIELYGTVGFTLLAVFALSRLFAAVGLWIKARWGAVLLVGATTLELLLYLSGSRDVQMTMFGFAVRLVLLVAIVLILFVSIKWHRDRVHD